MRALVDSCSFTLPATRALLSTALCHAAPLRWEFAARETILACFAGEFRQESSGPIHVLLVLFAVI